MLNFRSLAASLAVLAFSVLLANAMQTNWFSFEKATTGVSAQQKQQAILENLMKDPEPASWMPSWKSLLLLFENMNVSFDHASDFIPNGREKLIHQYVPIGYPFCGFLRSFHP